MTAADRKRQQGAMRHWHQSALRDLAVAEDNFKLRHYHWALFLCHLALEKLLKALVAQSEQEPPFTHRLTYLWQMSDVPLSEIHLIWLKEIERYNIEGRYDDEKHTFYLKSTKAYTEKWFARCREVFVWLENQLD